MSKEKVLQAMKNAGKAMKTGEIAEAAGLDKKVFDKAMKELKIEGAIVSPKKCYWEASGK
ncbi:MAG: transcriptional regulator [Prolixibacteraceae bacterium]|nr:transcriptional regulator [Prolixibacteraceae bacterium]